MQLRLWRCVRGVGGQRRVIFKTSAARWHRHNDQRGRADGVPFKLGGLGLGGVNGTLTARGLAVVGRFLLAVEFVFGGQDAPCSLSFSSIRLTGWPGMMVEMACL